MQVSSATAASSTPKFEMTIRQPPATLRIQQPPAIIDMQTTPSKLTIDSSQVRSELGNIGPIESTEKYAELGKQAAIKGITRCVQEGQQMRFSAGKGQGRAIIHNVIKQRTFPRPPKIALGFLPSIGAVKIDYTPSKLDINVQTRPPIIDVQVNKPIIDFTK